MAFFERLERARLLDDDLGQHNGGLSDTYADANAIWMHALSRTD